MAAKWAGMYCCTRGCGARNPAGFGEGFMALRACGVEAWRLSLVDASPNSHGIPLCVGLSHVLLGLA